MCYACRCGGGRHGLSEAGLNLELGLVLGLEFAT